MIQAKIKSKASLKSALKNYKKIVFTNGCFDLLHPGHVTYLESARALGDCLIVGVNSDASVKKLKGPTRPLNSLHDRMIVLAALESVSYVVPFKEETPLKLIETLKPKILVKGGDWTPEKIVGGKETLARGGKVISLPYFAGKSTTKIIAKANDQKKRPTSAKGQKQSTQKA